MAKEYIRLTTKIETWKDRFNDLTNDVGDIALLTTSGEFVVGSDSDLVTAINELDYRLDSINFTQLNSPDMYIHDSARIGGQLVVGGNLTVKGSVTLGDDASDNVVFNADVNSNIIPNTDNTYNLGSATQEWKHLYLNGTANIDNLLADSATISGALKANGGITVDTNKFIVADATGNTTIAGTLDVDGVTTLDSATVDGPLHVTGNVQVDGTLTVDGAVTFKAGSSGSINLGDNANDNVVFNADVNSNILPNTDNTYDLGSSSKEWRDLYLGGTANIDNLLADSATISGALKANGGITVDTNKFIVADTTGNTTIAGTLNVDGATTLDSATVDGPLSVTGNVEIGGTLTVDGVVSFKAGSSGSINLGDANTDNVVFNADVNSHILPNSDNTYDLGSSSKEWRNLYIDGTANIDTLSAGAGTITGNLDVQGITTLDSATVDGTLSVTKGATLASATVSDLTNNRIVIVGTSGALEDDSDFTFDGTTFKVGTTTTDKFTVAVTTGNTNIAGTLNVDGATTLDSATVDGTLTVTGKLNNFTLLNGEGDSGSYIQFSNKSRLIWGPTGIRIKGATAGADAELQDNNLDTVSKGTTSAINELKSTIDALNSTLTDSIDALFTQIGDLSSLNTAAQSNLVAAINEIHNQDSDRNVSINDKVGTLSSLNTAAQTSLVAALNEIHNQDSDRNVSINDNVGTLSSLNTAAQSNLVAAINEIHDQDSDRDSDMTAYVNTSISNINTLIGTLAGLDDSIESGSSSIITAINFVHNRIPNIYDSAGTLLN